MTLFAPSDDAFAKIPFEILAKLTNDDKFKIVQRHLINTSLTADKIKTDTYQTYGTETIELIKTDEGGVQIKYKGNLVNVITPNIIASNGVIHVIDKVILEGTVSKRIVNHNRRRGDEFTHPTHP